MAAAALLLLFQQFIEKWFEMRPTTYTTHLIYLIYIYNVIIKSIEKDTRICFEMETKRRKANEKKMVRRQKLVLMKWKCGFGVVVRLYIFPKPPK